MKRPFFLLISLGLACLVVMPQWRTIPRFKLGDDAPSYIRMAEGHSDAVPAHRARRILYPWLAGRLGRFVGLDLAFLVIAILSLVGFLWLNLDLLSRTTSAPLFIVLVIVFLPSLFKFFSELYLPTLFFVALSGVFWLLMIKKKYLLCLPVLFVMYLTRDEAILLAACWLFILWRTREEELRKATKVFLTAGIAAASILGIVTVNRAARTNANMHEMSNFVFSVARVPLFYMGNVTGFEHWVDTYRTLPAYGREPIFAVDVPSFFWRLTSIRRLGIYRWNPANVVGTLLCLLGVFGTGPTILYLFRKKLKEQPFRSVGLRTAYLFGLLIMLISPGLGPATPRYYFSAWPLFLFTLPWLLRRGEVGAERFPAAVFAAYVVSTWIFGLTFWPLGLVVSLVLLAAEAGLHAFTWLRLRPWARALS